MMGSYRYESPNVERKTISRTIVRKMSTFNSDPMRDKFRRISCSAPTADKAGIIAYDIKRHIIETKEQVKRSPNFVKRTHSKIIYLHNYNCRVAQVCSMYPLEDSLKQLLVKYIELEMSILKNPEYDSASYRLSLETRLMTLLSTIYSKYCFYTKGRFSNNDTWQYILELFEEVPYSVHTFFEDIRRKVIDKIDPDPDPEFTRGDPTAVKSQLTCYKVPDGSIKVEMDEDNDPLLRCLETYNIVREKEENAGGMAMGNGCLGPLEGEEVILSDDELTDTGQQYSIKQEYNTMFFPNLTERLKSLKRDAAFMEDKKPVIIDLCDENRNKNRSKTQTPGIIMETNLRSNTVIDLLDCSDDEVSSKNSKSDSVFKKSPAFSRKCDKPVNSVIYVIEDSCKNENVISSLSRTVPERTSDVLISDGGRSERDSSTCDAQDERDILRQIRELKLLSGSSEVTITMINNRLVISPKDNLSASDVNNVTEKEGVSSVDTTSTIQSSPVESEPVNKDKHSTVVNLCTESLPHQQRLVSEKENVSSLDITSTIQSAHVKTEHVNQDKHSTVVNLCIESLPHQQRLDEKENVSSVDTTSTIQSSPVESEPVYKDKHSTVNLCTGSLPHQPRLDEMENVSSVDTTSTIQSSSVESEPVNKAKHSTVNLCTESLPHQQRLVYERENVSSLDITSKIQSSSLESESVNQDKHSTVVNLCTESLRHQRLDNEKENVSFLDITSTIQSSPVESEPVNQDKHSTVISLCAESLPHQQRLVDEKENVSFLDMTSTIQSSPVETEPVTQDRHSTVINLCTESLPHQQRLIDEKQNVSSLDITSSIQSLPVEKDKHSTVDNICTESLSHQHLVDELTNDLTLLKSEEMPAYSESSVEAYSCVESSVSSATVIIYKSPIESELSWASSDSFKSTYEIEYEQLQKNSAAVDGPQNSVEATEASDSSASSSQDICQKDSTAAHTEYSSLSRNVENPIEEDQAITPHTEDENAKAISDEQSTNLCLTMGEEISHNFKANTKQGEHTSVEELYQPEIPSVEDIGEVVAKNVTPNEQARSPVHLKNENVGLDEYILLDDDVEEAETNVDEEIFLKEEIDKSSEAEDKSGDDGQNNVQQEEPFPEEDLNEAYSEKSYQESREENTINKNTETQKEEAGVVVVDHQNKTAEIEPQYVEMQKQMEECVVMRSSKNEEQKTFETIGDEYEGFFKNHEELPVDVTEIDQDIENCKERADNWVASILNTESPISNTASEVFLEEAKYDQDEATKISTEDVAHAGERTEETIGDEYEGLFKSHMESPVDVTEIDQDIENTKERAEKWVDSTLNKESPISNTASEVFLEEAKYDQDEATKISTEDVAHAGERTEETIGDEYEGLFKSHTESPVDVTEIDQDIENTKERAEKWVDSTLNKESPISNTASDVFLGEAKYDQDEATKINTEDVAQAGERTEETIGDEYEGFFKNHKELPGDVTEVDQDIENNKDMAEKWVDATLNKESPISNTASDVFLEEAKYDQDEATKINTEDVAQAGERTEETIGDEYEGVFKNHKELPVDVTEVDQDIENTKERAETWVASTLNKESPISITASNVCLEEAKYDQDEATEISTKVVVQTGERNEKEIKILQVATCCQETEKLPQDENLLHGNAEDLNVEESRNGTEAAEETETVPSHIDAVEKDVISITTDHQQLQKLHEDKQLYVENLQIKETVGTCVDIATSEEIEELSETAKNLHLEEIAETSSNCGDTVEEIEEKMTDNTTDTERDDALPQNNHLLRNGEEIHSEVTPADQQESEVETAVCTTNIYGVDLVQLSESTGLDLEHTHREEINIKDADVDITFDPSKGQEVNDKFPENNVEICLDDSQLGTQQDSSLEKGVEITVDTTSQQSVENVDEKVKDNQSPSRSKEIQPQSENSFKEEVATVVKDPHKLQFEDVDQLTEASGEQNKNPTEDLSQTDTNIYESSVGKGIKVEETVAKLEKSQDNIGTEKLTNNIDNRAILMKNDNRTTFLTNNSEAVVEEAVSEQKDEVCEENSIYLEEYLVDNIIEISTSDYYEECNEVELDEHQADIVDSEASVSEKEDDSLTVDHTDTLEPQFDKNVVDTDTNTVNVSKIESDMTHTEASDSKEDMSSNDSLASSSADTKGYENQENRKILEQPNTEPKASFEDGQNIELPVSDDLIEGNQSESVVLSADNSTESKRDELEQRGTSGNQSEPIVLSSENSTDSKRDELEQRDAAGNQSEAVVHISENSTDNKRDELQQRDAAGNQSKAVVLISENATDNNIDELQQHDATGNPSEAIVFSSENSTDNKRDELEQHDAVGNQSEAIVLNSEDSTDSKKAEREHDGGAFDNDKNDIKIEILSEANPSSVNIEDISKNMLVEQQTGEGFSSNLVVPDTLVIPSEDCKCKILNENTDTESDISDKNEKLVNEISETSNTLSWDASGDKSIIEELIEYIIGTIENSEEVRNPTIIEALQSLPETSKEETGAIPEHQEDREDVTESPDLPKQISELDKEQVAQVPDNSNTTRDIEASNSTSTSSTSLEIVLDDVDLKETDKEASGVCDNFRNLKEDEYLLYKPEPVKHTADQLLILKVEETKAREDPLQFINTVKNTNKNSEEGALNLTNARNGKEVIKSGNSEPSNDLQPLNLATNNNIGERPEKIAAGLVTQQNDVPQESGRNNHGGDRKNAEEVNKIELQPSDIPSTESVASYLPKNGEKMENRSLVVYNADEDALHDLRQSLSKFGTDEIPKTNNNGSLLLLADTAIEHGFISPESADRGSDSEGLLLIDEDSYIPQEYPEVQSEVILGPSENHIVQNEFVLQIQNSYQTLLGKDGGKRKKSPSSLKNSITLYQAESDVPVAVAHSIVEPPADIQRNLLHVPTYQDLNTKHRRPNILRRNPKNNAGTNEKKSYLQPKLVVLSDEPKVQRPKTKAEKKQMPTFPLTQKLECDSDDDVPLAERVKSRTPSPKKAKSRYGTTDIVIGRPKKNEVNVQEEKRASKKTRGKSGDRLKNASELHLPCVEETTGKHAKSKNLSKEQEVGVGEPPVKKTRRKSGELHRDTEKSDHVSKNQRKLGENFVEKSEIIVAYSGLTSQAHEEVEEVKNKDNDSRKAYRSKLRPRSTSGSDFTLDNVSLPTVVSASHIIEPIGMCVEIKSTDLDSKEVSKRLHLSDRLKRRSVAANEETSEILIASNNDPVPDKIPAAVKSDDFVDIEGIPSYVSKLRRKSGYENHTEIVTTVDPYVFNIENESTNDKKPRAGLFRGRKSGKGPSDQKVLPAVKMSAGRGRGRGRGRKSMKSVNNVNCQEQKTPSKVSKTKKDDTDLPLIAALSITPKVNSTLETMTKPALTSTSEKLKSPKKVAKKPNLRLDLSQTMQQPIPNPTIAANTPTEVKENFHAFSTSPAPFATTPKERCKREFKNQIGSAKTDVSSKTLDLGLIQGVKELRIDETTSKTQPIQENLILECPKEMPELKDIKKVLHPKLRGKSLFSNCKNHVGPTAQKLLSRLQVDTAKLIDENEKGIVEKQNKSRSLTQLDKNPVGGEKLNHTAKQLGTGVENIMEREFVAELCCGENRKASDEAESLIESQQSTSDEAKESEDRENIVKAIDQSDNEYYSLVFINLAADQEREDLKAVPKLEHTLEQQSLKADNSLSVAVNIIENTTAIKKAPAVLTLSTDSEPSKNESADKNIPLPLADKLNSSSTPESLEPVNCIEEALNKQDKPQPSNLKLADESNCDHSLEDSILDDIPLSKLRDITDSKKVHENLGMKCAESEKDKHTERFAEVSLKLDNLDLAHDVEIVDEHVIPFQNPQMIVQTLSLDKQLEYKVEEPVLKDISTNDDHQSLAPSDQQDVETVSQNLSSDQELKHKLDEIVVKDISTDYAQSVTPSDQTLEEKQEESVEQDVAMNKNKSDSFLNQQNVEIVQESSSEQIEEKEQQETAMEDLTTNDDQCVTFLNQQNVEADIQTSTHQEFEHQQNVQVTEDVSANDHQAEGFSAQQNVEVSMGKSLEAEIEERHEETAVQVATTEIQSFMDPDAQNKEENGEERLEEITTEAVSKNDEVATVFADIKAVIQTPLLEQDSEAGDQQVSAEFVTTKRDEAPVDEHNVKTDIQEEEIEDEQKRVTTKVIAVTDDAPQNAKTEIQTPVEQQTKDEQQNTNPTSNSEKSPDQLETETALHASTSKPVVEVESTEKASATTINIQFATISENDATVFEESFINRANDSNDSDLFSFAQEAAKHACEDFEEQGTYFDDSGSVIKHDLHISIGNEVEITDTPTVDKEKEKLEIQDKLLQLLHDARNDDFVELEKQDNNMNFVDCGGGVVVENQLTPTLGDSVSAKDDILKTLVNRGSSSKEKPDKVSGNAKQPQDSLNTTLGDSDSEVEIKKKYIEKSKKKGQVSRQEERKKTRCEKPKTVDEDKKKNSSSERHRKDDKYRPERRPSWRNRSEERDNRSSSRGDRSKSASSNSGSSLSNSSARSKDRYKDKDRSSRYSRSTSERDKYKDSSDKRKTERYDRDRDAIDKAGDRSRDRRYKDAEKKLNKYETRRCDEKSTKEKDKYKRDTRKSSREEVKHYSKDDRKRDTKEDNKRDRNSSRSIDSKKNEKKEYSKDRKTELKSKSNKDDTKDIQKSSKDDRNDKERLKRLRSKHANTDQKSYNKNLQETRQDAKMPDAKAQSRKDGLFIMLDRESIFQNISNSTQKSKDVTDNKKAKSSSTVQHVKNPDVSSEKGQKEMRNRKETKIKEREEKSKTLPVEKPDSYSNATILKLTEAEHRKLSANSHNKDSNQNALSNENKVVEKIGEISEEECSKQEFIEPLKSSEMLECEVPCSLLSSVEVSASEAKNVDNIQLVEVDQTSEDIKVDNIISDEVTSLNKKLEPGDAKNANFHQLTVDVQKSEGSEVENTSDEIANLNQKLEASDSTENKDLTVKKRKLDEDDDQIIEATPQPKKKRKIEFSKTQRSLMKEFVQSVSDINQKSISEKLPVLPTEEQDEEPIVKTPSSLTKKTKVSKKQEIGENREEQSVSDVNQKSISEEVPVLPTEEKGMEPIVITHTTLTKEIIEPVSQKQEENIEEPVLLTENSLEFVPSNVQELSESKGDEIITKQKNQKMSSKIVEQNAIAPTEDSISKNIILQESITGQKEEIKSALSEDSLQERIELAEPQQPCSGQKEEIISTLPEDSLQDKIELSEPHQSSVDQEEAIISALPEDSLQDKIELAEPQQPCSDQKEEIILTLPADSLQDKIELAEPQQPCSDQKEEIISTLPEDSLQDKIELAEPQQPCSDQKEEIISTLPDYSLQDKIELAEPHQSSEDQKEAIISALPEDSLQEKIELAEPQQPCAVVPQTDLESTLTCKDITTLGSSATDEAIQHCDSQQTTLSASSEVIRNISAVQQVSEDLECFSIPNRGRDNTDSEESLVEAEDKLNCVDAKVDQEQNNLIAVNSNIVIIDHQIIRPGFGTRKGTTGGVLTEPLHGSENLQQSPLESSESSLDVCKNPDHPADMFSNTETPATSEKTNVSKVGEKCPTTPAQEPFAIDPVSIESSLSQRNQKRGRDEELSERGTRTAENHPQTVQSPSMELYHCNENSSGVAQPQEIELPQKRSRIDDDSLTQPSTAESQTDDAKLKRQTDNVLASLALRDDASFFELSLVTDVTESSASSNNRLNLDVPLQIANYPNHSSNKFGKLASDIQPKQVLKTSQEIINEAFEQFLGSSRNLSKAQSISCNSAAPVNFGTIKLAPSMHNSIAMSQIITDRVASEPKTKISTQPEQSANESIDFKRSFDKGQDLYEKAPNYFRNPSPPMSTNINSLSTLDFRNPSPPMPTSLNCLPVLESRSKSIDLDPYSVGEVTQRPAILPDFVENNTASESLSFVPTTVPSTEVNIYGNSFQNNLITSRINSRYNPGKHIYQNCELSKLVVSSQRPYYNQQTLNTSSGSITVPSTSANVLTNSTQCVQALPDYMQELKQNAFCEVKPEKESQFAHGEELSDILPSGVKFLEEYPCASPEQLLPNFNRTETFKGSPATSSVSQQSENTRDTVDVNSTSSSFHIGDHTYPKDVLMNWHNEDKNDLNQNNKNPTGNDVKTEYEMEELEFDLSLIDESSASATGIFRHYSSIPTDGVWQFGVEPENPNKILTTWDDSSKVVVEPQPQDYSTYYPDFSCLNNSLTNDITELSHGSESSDLDKGNIDLTEWFDLSGSPEILSEDTCIEKPMNEAMKANKEKIMVVKEIRVPKAKVKKKPQLFIPARTKVSAPKVDKEIPSASKDISSHLSVPESKQPATVSQGGTTESEQLPQLVPLSGVTTRSASKKDSYVTPQSQSIHLTAKSVQVFDSEAVQTSENKVSSPSKTVVITNGVPGRAFTVDALLLQTIVSQPKTNAKPVHVSNSNSPRVNLASSKELVHNSPPKDTSQQPRILTRTAAIGLQTDALKQKQVIFSKEDVKGQTVRLQVVSPTFLKYISPAVKNVADSSTNAPPLVALQRENHPMSPVKEPVEVNHNPPDPGKSVLNATVSKKSSVADSSKKSLVSKSETKTTNKRPSNNKTPEHSLLFETRSMTRKVKEVINPSGKRPSAEERVADAKRPCVDAQPSDPFDKLVESPVNPLFKHIDSQVQSKDSQRRDSRPQQCRTGSNEHHSRNAPPPQGGARHGHSAGDYRGPTEKRQSQHSERSRSAGGSSRWRSSSPGVTGRERDRRSSKYTPPDLRSKSDMYKSNDNLVTSPSESLFPELPHKTGSSSTDTRHSDGSKKQHGLWDRMMPKVDPEWMLLPTQSRFNSSGGNSK